jgi:hypothetical protein
VLFWGVLVVDFSSFLWWSTGVVQTMIASSRSSSSQILFCSPWWEICSSCHVQEVISRSHPVLPCWVSGDTSKILCSCTEWSRFTSCLCDQKVIMRYDLCQIVDNLLDNLLYICTRDRCSYITHTSFSRTGRFSAQLQIQNRLIDKLTSNFSTNYLLLNKL